MKRWVIIALTMAAPGMMAQEASAHRDRTEASRHHHRHVTRLATGIVVVPALVPRVYYTYPSFWYPGFPPLYATPAPMTAPNYATDASGYAYFCPDSRRYYPDVRECPSPWLAVVPGVGGPPAN